jgi:hypothetical protein
MGIVEAIVDKLSGASGTHHVQRSQDAKVLRDTRCRDANDLCEITGAEFLAQQAMDNLGPRGIGERAKQLRHALINLVGGEPGARLRHRVGMHAARLATICRQVA